ISGIIQSRASMARPLHRALALVFFAGAGAARASTPDVFGLGSASTALAGAVSARATDFSAAFYNPAGLALAGPEREVSFGVTSYTSRLRLRGQDAPMTDPTGYEIGLRAPLPLGGALAGRLAFGLALHLVPDEIVRVVAHVPADAFFPYYDNRTQRLVL